MDGPNWMDRLPDEMLVIVLSFLPARDLLLAARGVCRRWRDLVPDRRVWCRCSLRVVSTEDVPLAVAALSVAPCLPHLLLDAGRESVPVIPQDYVNEVLVAAAPVPIASLQLRGTWRFAKRAIAAAQAKHLQSLSVAVLGGSISMADILGTVSKLRLAQLTLSTGSQACRPLRCGPMAPSSLASGGARGSSVERSLKRLDITCLNLPDSQVAALVRASAHSLEEVRIVNASCPLAVAALSGCAGRLRHLDLYLRQEVPAVLLMCHRLTSLFLRRVTSRQDDEMREFFESSAATGLKYLTLQNSDARATFKWLGSLAASGRSSLVHLRLFSHDSSFVTPSVDGEEPLYGADFHYLRTLHLNDRSPQEFLGGWHSAPALQVVNLGGSECQMFGKCLLESILVAMDRAGATQLHVVRFKFILCESEAAHARLKCCHQHCGGSGQDSTGWTRMSPLCGIFSHVPSVECKLCSSSRNYNVSEWLWSHDDSFNFSDVLSKSTVYR